MPKQGELKWVEGNELTLTDINRKLGEIPGPTLEDSTIRQFAGMISGLFVGILVQGINLLMLSVDIMFKQQKTLLKNVLSEMIWNDGYYKSVILAAEYRYTEQDGGLWIPTHQLKVVRYIKG